jgi:hypothetical protein
MRTNQLNNKKSHNRIQSGELKCHKSLWYNRLQAISLLLPLLGSRETLVSHFLSMTYNGQLAVLFLSDPSTLCHNFAEFQNMSYPDSGIHRIPQVPSNADTKKPIIRGVGSGPPNGSIGPYRVT